MTIRRSVASNANLRSDDREQTSDEGAHHLLNRSDAPVRYLMVSNRPSPDAVEYPDSRQLTVMAFTNSQFGRALWDIRTLEDRAD